MATDLYIAPAEGVGLGTGWLNRALLAIWGPADITAGVIAEPYGGPGEQRWVEAVGVLVLVEECEAFLTGTYAEYLAMGGAPVPLWARLNPLCHRDAAGLARLAAGARWGRSTWPAATAYLARQVLRTAARHGVTVAEVQSAALVPLELALADRPIQTRGQPLELVRAVTGVLRDHPSLRG